MKLEISLFKFDKNSDYLPYYTKHFLKIEDEKNILDILNTINKNAKLGFENCSDFDLVINGVFVKASITLEEVVKNFGKELTIEPISIRRAYNDLLIDENEVTAGHAASVGRVDPEEMYYLMSRGLKKADAERLVIRGFLGGVLTAIPIKTVQQELVDVIEGKLNA